MEGGYREGGTSVDDKREGGREYDEIWDVPIGGEVGIQLSAKYSIREKKIIKFFASGLS